jgi:hypothetical protein
MVYFVRAKGATLHNNPNVPGYYVPGEPPIFPKTAFNYADFCLERGIIRIGWPDTGALNASGKTGALAHGYTLESLKPYI